MQAHLYYSAFMVLAPVIVAMVTLFIGGTFLSPSPQDQAARVPVVVELFTSEGCSSCPQADTLLAALVREQPVQGAQVIALGEHVDYWNRLGWQDPFSSPGFTRRQDEYRRRLNADQLYTPQMIVDGRDAFVGSDRGAARKAIAKAAKALKATVNLSVGTPSHVEVTVRVAGLQRAGLRQPAHLILAVTEGGLTSNVERGENSGRRLSHAAVVRALTAVVEIAAGADTTEVAVPVVLESSWSRDHVSIVAFIQERDSGRILGAATTLIR